MTKSSDFPFDAGWIGPLVSMLIRWLNFSAVWANSSCGAVFLSIVESLLFWLGKQSLIRRSIQFRRPRKETTIEVSLIATLMIITRKVNPVCKRQTVVLTVSKCVFLLMGHVQIPSKLVSGHIKKVRTFINCQKT